MHKILSFTAVLTLVGLLASPLAVFAQTTAQSVGTGLTRVDGGGQGPIIKAKWEMKDLVGTPGVNPGVGEAGLDDSGNAGAQFLPTGTWGVRDPSPDTTGEMKYSICTIVTDPDGVSDIDGVYTDIYYPAGIAAHQGTHPNLDNNLGGQATNANNPTTPDLVTYMSQQVSPDYDHGNQYGCTLPVEDENQLTQLSKTAGIELFCNQIRTNNNLLPTFFPNPAFPPTTLYNYDEICGVTGELEKETAYVYCADKNLEWEDPSGLYTVEILSLDKSGQFSHSGTGPINPLTGTNNPNWNQYEYLPMTSFEKDFTNVVYGNVKLNTHKRIAGDLTWDGVNNAATLRPSVRNTGNTRLYMGVRQDDMGLGTTDLAWNVRYDARVGSSEQDWRYYTPEYLKNATATGSFQLLEDILDLSELEEMDFSIEIFKFPNTSSGWIGVMELNATSAPHRQCSA